MSRQLLPALLTDCVAVAPTNTQVTTEGANASPSDFDFASYLRTIDSAQRYVLTEIASRPASVMVRARKELQQGSNLGQNLAQNFGAFPHHENLMLTYRPTSTPYSSDVGSSQPDPLQLEYVALSLFVRPEYHGSSPHKLLIRSLSRLPPHDKLLVPPGGALYRVAKKTGVKIPEPLRYDAWAGVLTTSYLGELCSLSKLFGCIFSANTTPNVTPPLGPAIRELVGCENASQMFFTSAGQSLGKFLAKLHAPKTAQRLRRVIPNVSNRTPGRSERATRTIREAIDQMRDHLKAWRSFFATNTELNDICLFSHGNCDFESVFVEVPLEQGAAYGPPGLINWTDAGCYGKGIVDDLARLMADLEMYKSVFEHHIALKDAGINVDGLLDLDSIGLALSYLKRGLKAGYKTKSKLYSTFHLKPMAQRTPLERLNHKGLLENTSLMSLERSTYLAHGLRIINLAFEKTWPCIDPSCTVDGQHTSVKEDCKVVQLMVRRGLWFLRMARVDEATFCNGEHRQNIHQGVDWPGCGRPWLPEMFTEEARGPWYKFGMGRGH
ncbi:hypothetical protein A1O1_02274 [Capronia coronata CBS 617.96]|uniref:Aminoglycoside phosphotransferase domain-containing protein n=1 Tax=Capronia coronata CBS 617.96 TaxID=1182541 RepID=W9YXA4_9EURO|nr:uncharacterized protein A1O1_02274 [Capronia coronata CBS 617.96]EXJ93881.1 hypothetical protein A1O1_02274 [Capronia coronata CBS 617.96]